MGANETNWDAVLAVHREGEAEIVLGGGERAIERHREKGRMTARERIAKLLDPETELLELGRWAAWNMYAEWGGAPAASVVQGVGRIAGRDVMIIANDATVKAGAFFPMTCKKVLRAQRIALVNRIPLVYLVDSAGVFLPLQDEIFPDEDDFGRIFRNNAVLSAAGIPQTAAIMGNCVAGGGYLPVLCDKVVMTEGSGLYLAGPALVKSAIGQEVSHEELGGATMHAAISGTVDFREPDDATCLARLRALVETLPGDPRAEVFRREDPIEPSESIESILDVVTPDPRHEYDAHDLLTRIVDGGSLQEYKAEYGRTLVCGYARIGGFQVGVLANQRTTQKTGTGELELGGALYHETADKAARFVMDCNQTWTPLVFLQDVFGFMVGRSSEQAGVIRSGAKLVNAISNSRVPKLTVIIGGSYGAGNYAMCGKAFDPRFVFAWPTAKYAVMGSQQAAKTLLDVNVSALKRQGREVDAAELADLRERIESSYETQTDIRYAAARGWVDAIIEPQQTRSTLIRALDLSTRAVADEPFRTGVLQV